MKPLLLVVAGVWALSGFCLYAHTQGTRQFFCKYFPPERTKRLAPVPLVLGLFLVVGAFVSHAFFWIPLILGLAAVAKGVYLFTASPQRVEEVLNGWFYAADDKIVKRWGLVSFALGMALLALAA